MRRFNIFSVLACAALFPLLCLTGCVLDQTRTQPVPGQPVTVELRIPAFELPETRSIDGSKGEAVISTIDLMIFDGQLSPPMLLHRYRPSDIRQSDTGPYYLVSFDVESDLFENARTLAVFANASAAVDYALTNPGGGIDGDKRKPDIMNWTRYIIDPAVNGGYKWKAFETDYTPIPMYGEVVVENITGGMKITGLELTRAMARVDIQNNVKKSIFELEEVYLVNSYMGGRVVPVYDPATGVLYKVGDAGYIYNQNIDPGIPGTVGKIPATQEGALKYTYNQDDDAVSPIMSGEIYTFECSTAPADDPSGRVGLILKGKYLGTECYYRVDFTTDKGGTLAPGEVALMPVYRNHKYTFTITAAEGVGYGTFEEALNSNTVLSNLKTSLHVVDMSGINEIVYDGQYFMGVESRTIDILWGASKDMTVRVGSNYQGSWKAEIVDPVTNGWLRFPGNRTTITGTDIGSSGIEISADALPPSSGGVYPSASIIYTAGRLRDTLTVRRVTIADMFARSNVVLNSSQLVFAVSADDNTTIPAYSQGLFFKWGSLFGIAPPGNPYAPATHIVYNPTGLDHSSWGGGMAGWDKIPYAHSIFGYTTPALSGDDMDAFKDYANGTGFDMASGIGDICRLISSRGWVEGKWRLPTYAELDMLYNETPVKPGVPLGGTFTDMTSALNASPSGNMGGMFNPGSGVLLGVNATGASVPPQYMATPPVGAVFIPAAGHRYPNGDGDVVHVGAYGYNWSCTPYDQVTVNYLFQSKYGVDFYDADRSYAFPVRCIKDY